MPGADFNAAHRCSIGHREQVLRSERCGCFCCCSIFAPAEIEPRMLRQGGPAGDATKTAESVKALIRSIDNLGDQDAKFMLYNGEVVPW